MDKFKGFDNVVHNAAEAITAAAQEKDMTKVVAQYQTLIAGCQSCHAVYKTRIAKALQ
jgi:cytochrome c556